MTLKDRILALPHVETISDERGSEDGIWVYYREGFKSTMDPKGALHQEHEDTWAEVYALAKRPLPCACEDCEAIKREKASKTAQGAL